MILSKSARVELYQDYETRLAVACTAHPGNGGRMYLVAGPPQALDARGGWTLPILGMTVIL